MYRVDMGTYFLKMPDKGKGEGVDEWKEYSKDVSTLEDDKIANEKFNKSMHTVGGSNSSLIDNIDNPLFGSKPVLKGTDRKNARKLDSIIYEKSQPKVRKCLPNEEQMDAHNRKLQEFDEENE